MKLIISDIKNEYKRIKESDNKEKIIIFMEFGVCFILSMFAYLVTPMAYTYEAYAPCFSYSMTKWLPFTCFAFMGLYTLGSLKDFKKIKKNIVLLIVPFTYFAILIFHTYGGYKGEYILALCVISAFMLMEDRMKAKTFTVFYWILQIANIISLIFYIAYIFDLKFPMEEVLYYRSIYENTGESYYCKLGIFAIIYNRLCGFFNEPGALGTICGFMYIIVYGKRSKLEEAILLITGMCTLSLAFVMIIFIFFLIKPMKDYKLKIISIIAVFIIFIALPYIDFHNDYLNYLAQRCKINGFKLVGDSRSSSVFQDMFNELMKSSKRYWGYGVGYISSLDNIGGNAGIKTFIYDFGIIGTAIMLLVWTAVGIYKSKDKYNYIYIIIFLISLYQRVYLRNIYAYIIFFGAIVWRNQLNEEKKNTY